MAPHARRPLDAAVLRAESVRPGATWRRLDVVTETGSTNADLIARSVSGDDIGGAVLLAEHQVAGRGRHGRSWSAPPYSQIAMSVGVPVWEVPSEAWGWLPLLTGVAVVEAVCSTISAAVGLKWPNDILVDEKKLAGILAEVASPQPMVVVGLGLNVSLTEEDLPVPHATSLTLLGSHMDDRNMLVTAILETLGARIDQWRSAGTPDPSLIADYRRHSMTLGTRVRASLPGDRQITGVASAIDELGRLQIDTDDGVVTMSAGDITHLRPVGADDEPQ